MQKQDCFDDLGYGQGKVLTKQLKHNLKHLKLILPQDEGLKSSFRNRTATGRDHVWDMVGQGFNGAFLGGRQLRDTTSE